MPRLTGIDASGSGDIVADGIEADAFEIRSDDSADISLAGAAGRLAVDLDGSGEADLSDLEVREARVAVGGSGDVDVRAEQRLDVTVDGSARLAGDGRLLACSSRSGFARRTASCTAWGA